jgi:hypothetical protein
MAQSGPQRPQLVYTQLRTEEIEAVILAKALELARMVEELLEDTRSIPSLGPTHPVDRPVEDARTHSTRMARAMAASLVDELDALVRPSRRTGSS